MSKKQLVWDVRRNKLVHLYLKPGDTRYRTDIDVSLLPDNYSQLQLGITRHGVVYVLEGDELAHRQLENLEPLKAVALDEIDKTAEHRIKDGFVWRSKRFSLSINAQAKWNAFNHTRHLLTYPLLVPVADDSETVSIASAEEVVEVLEAATLAIAQELQTANRVKQLVLEAETEEEVRRLKDQYMSILER